MKIKNLSILILFASTFLPFLMQFPASYAETFDSGDSSLEIQSDTMISQGKEKNIIFEGSVTARKGSITLKAGKMTAVYNDNRTIDEVIAEDNVVLIQKERRISANHAVYDSREETVTFTGEPVFSEGRNTVSGTKIIYYIDEERSYVENPKVILHEE